MQFSKETIEILTNFSQINPGLMFRAGNVLRTGSPHRAVVAEATVNETFERDFGVYNLGEFLSAISLHGNPPEITLHNDHATIAGDAGVTKYWYTEEKLIVLPPKGKINFPSEDVKFLLPSAALTKIKKASDLFQTPNIAFSSDGENVNLTAFDIKNQAAIPHTFKLDATSNGVKFKTIFKKENLNFLTLDYDVTISLKGIARFASEKNQISYHVSIEKINE